MSAPGFKKAHIIKKDGMHLVSFNKGSAAYIPPNLLFGATCTLMRDGKPCRDLGVWNPRRHGIVAGELEVDDCIHIQFASDEDFYANLFREGERQSGMVVWLDPDLKNALQMNRLDQQAA